MEKTDLELAKEFEKKIPKVAHQKHSLYLKQIKME